MKQLTLPTENYTTDLITNESFVGVFWTDIKRKSIIIKVDDFFSSISSDLNYGTNQWTNESKKGYAIQAIGYSKINKIFLFETKKQMLEWFAKDND